MMVKIIRRRSESRGGIGTRCGNAKVQVGVHEGVAVEERVLEDGRHAQVEEAFKQVVQVVELVLVEGADVEDRMVCGGDGGEMRRT